MIIFIIIAIGIALTALTVLGKIKLPIWVGLGIVAVGVFWGPIMALAANAHDEETTLVDECGCASGQLAVVDYKRGWLFKSTQQIMPCSSYMAHQDGAHPSRWRLKGCA